MKHNPPQQSSKPQDDSFWLSGRQPVLEALKANLPARELLLRRGSSGKGLERIRSLAAARGLPCEVLDESRMHRRVGSGDHRGVALRMELPEMPDWESFLEQHLLSGKALDDLCLVLLDGVQDPHNLGAILRSAHGAGVDAVLLPEKGSAPLGAAVYRSSAGAMAWQTVVRVPDSPWILDQLGKKGIQRLGLDAQLGQVFSEQEARRPVCLVLGSEGRGLAKRVQERLDGFLAIPLRGRVDSLNVSVAAGIIIYHWLARPEKGTKA